MATYDPKGTRPTLVPADDATAPVDALLGAASDSGQRPRLSVVTAEARADRGPITLAEPADGPVAAIDPTSGSAPSSRSSVNAVAAVVGVMAVAALVVVVVGRRRA